MPAGVYSDDTQLTLAVARSLQFADWWAHLTQIELSWWPHYELGGGGATRRAARSWSKQLPPWTPSGAKGYWTAGGNGAAMRVLPHCAFADASFDGVRARVLADGATTHGDPIALVGAQLYAHTLWTTLRYREPLEWGQLLDKALSDVDAWAGIDVQAVPYDWSSHLPADYDVRWGQAVNALVNKIQLARERMAQGALALDDDVLGELGCFSRESGAGTVTVACALYLASRHAAEPAQGILRSAFARGADTDTLTAMTGALLGALHGPQWIAGAADQLLDHDLLVRIGRELGTEPALPTAAPYSREAQAIVDDELARSTVGNELDVPFYGKISISDIRDLDNRNHWIRSWWFTNVDGQTFRVKRISRAKERPWRSLHRLDSVTQPNAYTRPRLRSGLIIYAGDLEVTQRFYEDVIGLEVTKKMKSAVVFAGWLAVQAGTTEGGQMRPDVAGAGPVSIGLYADETEFHRLAERLSRHGAHCTLIETKRGPSVRTVDPNGVAIEIRLTPTDTGEVATT